MTVPVDGAVVRHVTVAEKGPVVVVSMLEIANGGGGGGTGDVVTGAGGGGAAERTCALSNRIAPATATRSNADPAVTSASGLGHPRTQKTLAPRRSAYDSFPDAPADTADAILRIASRG
jgi:hypothetical protein